MQGYPNAASAGRASAESALLLLYICSARTVLCCGRYLDAASPERASSESALYCSARAVLCCDVVFMQGYPDAASAGRASAESALYCISVPLVRSYAVACIWALPLLKRQAQSLLCTVPLVRSYAVASRAARFMLVVPSMRGTCAMRGIHLMLMMVVRLQTRT